VTEQSGEIITFYSYKGGTGRSMAVANVAWILASAGKSVLMVDWDLEAPGLHHYFRPFLIDSSLRDSDGVIDMLWSFAQEALATAPDSHRDEPPTTWNERSELGESADEDWYADLAESRRYSISVNVDFPAGGRLALVPAGRQTQSYPHKVNAFGWDAFYGRMGGAAFIEAFKQSMVERYDYVLIDSRTGVSDTAGVCTVQMPDRLVICFTYNTQSIEGAAGVARSVHIQRPNMKIFPVAMRVEDGELERLDLARARAQLEFAQFLEHLDGDTAARYWAEVEVPYKVYYAYEEILATVVDPPHSRQTVLAALESLTRWVTDEGVDGLSTLQDRERNELLAAFERHTATPVDFLIVHSASQRSWGNWLAWNLTSAGFVPSTLLAEDEPGPEWRGIAERKGNAAGTVMPVVSAGDEEWLEDLINITSQKKLRPVLVSPVHLVEPLNELVSLDFVDVSADDDARKRLLEAVADRPHLPSFIHTGAKQPPVSAPPLPSRVVRSQDERDLLAGHNITVNNNTYATPLTDPIDVADRVSFGVPQPPDRLVGRDLVLAELYESLHRGSGETAVTAQHVALYGMGGIGKTALAASYCDEYRDEYGLIWWVPAETTAGLADQYVVFARWLGFGELDPQGALARIRGHLDERDSWLVVYDNAQDRKTIRPWLLRGVNGGAVLVTSRDPSGWASRVPVDILPTKVASGWLVEATGDPDQTAAATLAEELDGLPLALAQAVAYIDETGIGISGYLDRFRTEKIRLLGAGEPVGYEGTVDTTVTLAYEQLTAADPAAGRLIDVAAYCAPDHIPAELVAHPDTVKLDDQILIDQATAAAYRSGLIDRTLGLFSIHRLTQDVIRHHHTDSEPLATLITRLEDIYPTEPAQPDSWDLCGLLTPHLLSVWGHNQPDPTQPEATSWLLDRAAIYLQFRVGNYPEAKSLFVAAFDIRRQILGDEDPHTLASMNNLAVVLQSMGELDEARRLTQQALDISRRTLGEEHPDTLTSMNNLAVVLQSMGELDEARQLTQQAFDIRRQILGDEDPDTLASMNNLAVVLESMGEFDEARQLTQQALDISRRTLGDEHPDTLISMSNLASALQDIGELDEARQLWEKALPAAIRVWGDDHPNTQFIRSHLKPVGEVRR
jgi:tetratricopeptide (TPR) repeat protein